MRVESAVQQLVFSQGLTKSLLRGVSNTLVLIQRPNQVFVRTVSNQLNILGKVTRRLEVHSILSMTQQTTKSLSTKAVSTVAFQESTSVIRQRAFMPPSNMLIVSQSTNLVYSGVRVRFAQNPYSKDLYVPDSFNVKKAWKTWKNKFKNNDPSTWGRDFLTYLVVECGCKEVSDHCREIILNNQTGSGRKNVFN